MSKYILCELHNHTYHSDGRQTLLELAQQAKKLGFDAIALTDHNTNSGYDEIAEVHDKTDLFIIRGIEYTTFFGHFLVLGKREVMHFRNIYKKSFENVVKVLKTENSVVGIAHPFSIGNPVCTGCFFEYDKQHPDFEYMEVWSGVFPPDEVLTQLAMHTWDIMLNDSRKICGVLGRDWHCEEPLSKPPAATALLVGDECSQQNIDGQVVNAIKNRHAALTLYKIPDFSIEYRGCKYVTGDEILFTDEPAGYLSINMSLVSKMLSHKPNKFENLRVSLNSNGGILFTDRLDDEYKAYEFVISSQEIKSKKIIWLRMEVYGRFNDSEILVAITNPVFIIS